MKQIGTITYKGVCNTVRDLKRETAAWQMQDGVIDVQVQRFKHQRGGVYYVTLPYYGGGIPDGCF